MKKSNILLLVLTFIWNFEINAQSEIEQINTTLQHYIEGTANGAPERLKKAFHKDFKLFIVDSDTLKIIDGKGYIERVEKSKKYNRIGKIITIDYENDAASAKIEVYFPDRNRIATDYLLLLKIKGKWKILHKIINLNTFEKVADLQAKNTLEIDNINKALLHYIEGTANSDPARLDNAFHKDFNLYYIKKDTLGIIPGKKYMTNFTNGKTYNRIGKVVSIDYEDDAGLAKIQVLMPDRDRVAIDYLLLLKIKEEWKIIHKSFTSKTYGK